MADPAQKDPYDQPGNQDSGAPDNAKPKTVVGDDEKSEPFENSSTAAEPANEGSASTEPTDADRVQNQVGRGYTRAPSSQQGIINKLSANRRKVVIIGGLTTAIISLVIGLFSFILPAFKLPQFQAHLGRRLTRSARTFNDNVSILTSEKAAIDAATAEGDIAANKALTSSSPLGKALDTYKPKRVIDNMKASGNLDFTYKPGPLGTQILDEVTVGNRVIPTPDFKFGRLIGNRQKLIQFGKEINSATTQVLRNDDAGFMIRSQVSKRLLQSMGVSLQWWQRRGADEVGKSPQQALQDEQLKLFDEINTPSAGAATDGVTSTAQKAVEQERTCLTDATCAKQVSDGQLSLLEASGADKSINSLSDNIKIAGDTLGWISTFYAFAVPACIIYDGSVETSAAFVKAQNSAALKTFLAVSSAADQQKAGDVSAEGVGALNKLLGDVANSNPEKLARGETIDTTTEPYVQASRIRSYSIFDNIFQDPALAHAATFMADNVCPQLLNPGFMIGILTAELGAKAVLALTTGGTVDAAEEGAGVAAKAAVKKIITDALSHLTDPLKRKALQNTSLKFAFTQGKVIGATIAATDALTYGSRMLVLAEMGSFVNGADYGNLANQADMGAVLYNNELDRQQNFGRPMTNQEVAISQQQDKQYLAQQSKSHSLFQRYFAINNPDSWLVSMVTRGQSFFTSSHTLPSILGQLPRLFVDAIHPLSGVFNQHVQAASVPTTDTTNYNILQWGWSADEQQLKDNDPSFDPLINAQILAASGQTDAIQTTYGKCFTDDISTLLTNKSIVRDDNGNLVDDGTCSPTNLGPKNPTYGDLVFRWRVNQSYQRALDELTSIQDVSNAPTATATGNYQNPLRDVANLSVGRIDQGVDYGGSGPVYAIGNGKINTVTSGADWPGGVFINYTLTDGPAAGLNVFVAEHCTPVAGLGTTITIVTPSTVLCNMPGGDNAIETGWAADPSKGYIAAAHDVYAGKADGDPTACGQNFSDFMKSIPAPPGDISQSTSRNLLASCDGWPAWK